MKRPNSERLAELFRLYDRGSDSPEYSQTELLAEIVALRTERDAIFELTQACEWCFEDARDIMEKR